MDQRTVVVARFGFETGNKVVHGLWTSRSYLNLLDFLATNNFNAIRVLDPSLLPCNRTRTRTRTRTHRTAHAH
jgi:aryl-phospho-beta-D-glucosidase BglC (GH1 family)